MSLEKCHEKCKRGAYENVAVATIYTYARISANVHLYTILWKISLPQKRKKYSPTINICDLYWITNASVLWKYSMKCVEIFLFFSLSAFVHNYESSDEQLNVSIK